MSEPTRSERAPRPALPVEVHGVDALEPSHGPLFAVVGVFDGIHLGHRYLLEHLVGEARRRSAHPAVVTFDSHPDEVLVGAAPPLLVDPAERVLLLEAAGVEVVVVQHFDAVLRATEYDAFVHRITTRTRLAGLLMTPEAAFGYQRRGTPEALGELGARDGFDVVIVPPFTINGRPVSSSEIRRLVAAGDLAGAARLLGRPYEVVGLRDGADPALHFPLPVALPPDGEYDARVGPDGLRVQGRVRVEQAGAVVEVQLPDVSGAERLHVEFAERRR